MKTIQTAISRLFVTTALCLTAFIVGANYGGYTVAQETQLEETEQQPWPNEIVYQYTTPQFPLPWN